MTRRAITAAAVVAIVLTAAAVRAQTKVSAEDEQAIKKLAADFAEGWNSGSVNAIEALWTADGSLLDAQGQYTEGRPQVGQRYTQLLTGPFKGSKLASTVEGVRLVHPDVAVARGSSSLTGLKMPDGKDAPPLASKFTALVVKTDGKWMLDSLQNLIPYTLPAR